MDEDDDSKFSLMLPLSKDELYFIGLFIVTWNLTELVMEALVSRILEISLGGAQTIMGSIQVHVNCKILVALAEAKITDGTQKALIVDATNTVMGMADFRNEIAHGRWIWKGDPQKPGAVPFSTKKSLRAKPTLMTDLDPKYQSLLKAQRKLMRALQYFAKDAPSANPAPET